MITARNPASITPTSRRQKSSQDHRHYLPFIRLNCHCIDSFLIPFQFSFRSSLLLLNSIANLFLLTKYLTYIFLFGLFTVHLLFYCFDSYVVLFEQPLAKVLSYNFPSNVFEMISL